MKKASSGKKTVLPVAVVTQVAKLLRKAAADKSLPPQLRSNLLKAAIEMEFCLKLARDEQTSVPDKLIRIALHGLAYLLSFRHEIKELLDSWLKH